MILQVFTGSIKWKKQMQSEVKSWIVGKLQKVKVKVPWGWCCRSSLGLSQWRGECLSATQTSGLQVTWTRNLTNYPAIQLWFCRHSCWLIKLTSSLRRCHGPYWESLLGRRTRASRRMSKSFGRPNKTSTSIWSLGIKFINIIIIIKLINIITGSFLAKPKSTSFT